MFFQTYINFFSTFRSFTKMDWDIDDAFFEFVNSAVSSEVGSNTTNTTMSSNDFDTMDLTYELNNFLSQHVWKSEEKVSASNC